MTNLLDHISSLRFKRGGPGSDEIYQVYGFEVDDEGAVVAVADIIGWGGTVNPYPHELILIEDDKASN